MMHFPQTFELLGARFSSYYLFLSLAVIVSSSLTLRMAQKFKFNLSLTYNLLFIGIISGYLGAFLGGKNGLSWSAGITLSFITCGIYLKLKKVKSYFSFADLSAISLSIGYIIMRIGCWLNGCCYGDNYSAQLVMALAECFVLLYLVFHIRRQKNLNYLFNTWLILHSIARIATHNLRIDLNKPSVWLFLVFAVCGVMLLQLRVRRNL